MTTPGPMATGEDGTVDRAPCAVAEPGTTSPWCPARSTTSLSAVSPRPKLSDQLMMKFGLAGVLVLESMVTSFQVPLMPLASSAARNASRPRPRPPEPLPSGS